MKKRIFASLVALVMMVGAFPVMAAEEPVINEGFDGYVSAGVTIPAGWVDRNNTLNNVTPGDPTSVYQIINENESGNTIMTIKKQVTDSGSLGALAVNKTGLGDVTGENTVFQMRFKQNQTATGDLNCPVYLYYGTGTTAINPFTVRSNTQIRGLGGSSTSTLISSSVVAGKWYTITLTSKVYEQEGTKYQKMISYVNGDFVEEAAPAAVTEDKPLNEIRLQMLKATSAGLANSFDDVRVYTPGDFTAEVLGSGKRGISSPVIISFNSPIVPAEVSKIALYDSKNNIVATQAQVSEDQTKVTLTPVSPLSYSSTYSARVNHVTSLLDDTVTTSADIETESSPVHLYYEPFDTYTDTTGSVAPSGYVIENRGTQTIKSETADDNTYAWLYGGANSTDGQIRILNTLSTPPSGDFIVRFSFKNDSRGGNQEDPIFRLVIGGYTQNVTWKHYDGLKRIVAIGSASTTVGNATGVRALEANGGTLSELSQDNWYDVVIVSNVMTVDSAQVQRLSYYVNGVFHGYLDNVITTVPSALTQLGFMMSKNETAARSFCYDNIAVYNDRGLEVLNGPDIDGEENLPVTTPLEYTFSAPIQHTSLQNITLKNDSDVTIDASVSYIEGDMTKIKITPAAGLSYDTDYTLTLNVADVLGNQFTDEIAFSTKEFNDGGVYGEHSLYIVGDSTAADVPKTTENLAGWGKVFNTFTNGDLTVCNEAVAGQSARSFYNGYWTNVLAKVEAGDYVIFQWGHNDRSGDGASDPTLDGTVESIDNGDGETTYSFKWYMNQFIGQTLAKGAIPILATPTETNKGTAGETYDFTADTQRERFCTAIEELAQAHEVSLLDINDLTRNYFTDQSQAEEGIQKLHKIFGDKIHFKYYGALCVSGIVADALLNSRSSLKDYLVDISSLALCDSSGYEANLAAGGTFTAKLFVKTNGSDFAASLIAASYNAGTVKRLTASSIDSLSINTNLYETKEVSISVPAGAESLKLFIWNNMTDRVPLAPALVVPEI